MKSGDRIVAESSWNYILYLYSRRMIESPADVIDANYPPRHDRLDVCQIPWLVGNPDSAGMIRAALGHCRHQRVLSSTTPQYYFDTTLLRAVEVGADLAVGSRYILGGSIPNWSAWRRALSRWGNRYARWVLALPLADATSGFRAYRADLVTRLDLPSVRSDGYGFQIEMAYRVARANGGIVEVAIEFVDGEHGMASMIFTRVGVGLLVV